MLPRQNRVTRASDFRAVSRRGRRVSSEFVVVHVLRRGDGAETRFGFIVSKRVGNAVRRNVVKRRLRSVSSEILESLDPAMDVVVRALPLSADASWPELRTSVSESIGKGAMRA